MTLRIITFGTLSVRSDKGTVAGAAGQPRRLALLALLARAGTRGVTREKLTALVWPDADDERSRRAITQSIYALRQELGSDDMIVGVKELHLNPDLITSDVAEFSAALKAGQPEDAVRLHTGPFLDGFHLTGNDEFDRWVDSERAVLHQECLESLEKLAVAADTQGDHATASGWWRRLSAKDPLSARYALGLMQSLMGSGDKHGALEHARIHETLLEEQLDLPADRDVVALAARIRRELRASARAEAEAQAAEATVAVAEPPDSPLGTPNDSTEPPAASPASVEPDEPETDTRDTAPVGPPDVAPPVRRIEARVAAESPLPDKPTRTRWPRLVAGAAVIALAVAAIAYARRRDATDDGEPIVAVGRITDYSAGADRPYGLPLSDLLATNLARVQGLRVVSTARMLELLRQSAEAGDTTAAAVLSAARVAGATEVIDGIVYARPDGRLRLDLRRIGVRTGNILQAQTVEGADLFALVDSGTAHLVAAHGVTPPSAVSSVTTRSAAAYILYAQGLRAYANGDSPAARNLFGAALREDSTFAMAAFYYGRLQTYRPDLVRNLDRALRLSANASERERLMIHAGWAWVVSARELGPVADSLVERYPQETQGHLYQGAALVMNGDFMKGIPPLERVIAMDSLSFTRMDSTSGCIACEAFFQVVLAYELADSLAAAERAARRWTRLAPESSRSWVSLWDVLERAGKFDEAQRVASRIAQMDRDAITATDRTAMNAIRTGQFELADRVLRGAIQGGSSAGQNDAMWDLVISLRHQGRAAEAMTVAREYRALADSLQRTRPDEVSSAVRPLGTALVDAGRFREAAALFDSSASYRAGNESPASQARERAWSLAHAARALAAAGDTSELAARADTIAAVGAQSASARDQRLAFYVRGLLYLARNALPDAEKSIAQSLYSLPGGYTRENYDLARVYLRMGRPRDAISVLQPVLRGKLDASNFYVTQTEIHELLAQAWDSAGGRDSARVHYAWVARVWARGDPPYAKRAGDARQRLAALGGK